MLLTLLKKLFAQRGSGRIEEALYRGLDGEGQELVPAVLALLRKHGFAERSKHGGQMIWIPSKPFEYRRRALGILATPSLSVDPLVLESRELGS